MTDSAAAQTAILRLETTAQGVAVLWMDDPRESQNTLTLELVREIDRVLADLERDSELRGLVFISGKQNSFVAGANLQMLQSIDDAPTASELARTGQAIFDRIATLSCPTVAAIHGPCLGGGLELALAFDGRIASHDPATRLGLPEVQLGLLPGGGGTQRLPALIDIQTALDMLLTGRQLGARQALRCGLVDEVVAPSILLDAALELAGARARGVRARTRPWPTRLLNTLLTRTPPGRRLVLSKARSQVMEKSRGLYPAPLRILDVVERGLARGRREGLRSEAETFGELVVTPQSRELVNLFFASTELKKHRWVADDVAPRPVDRLAILGGGLMGAGMAYVSIHNAGIDVRIKDRDHAGVANALRYNDALLRRRVQRRRASDLERRQTMARLSGGIDYRGFRDVPLVIEAVFEDLALKQEMVRQIEANGREDVIFASNTSALPITGIAAASRHPETVIGMHYFSPVEKMPLLEIVETAHTAPWVTATCVEVGRRQGKTVIVVNDGAGFYTSRILVPFMLEAAHLLTEGVAVDAIDRALLDAGFPVGPMTLLDEVGIDVGHKVASNVAAAFGDRFSVPPQLDRLVEDGRLGRKNGRGLYQYGGKSRGQRPVDESVYELLEVATRRSLPAEEIAERCLLGMVNEAVHCLGEQILRCPRDGDIGAVFGLGFPPLLGGPFRYIDARGAGAVLDRLGKLEQRHGARFSPAQLLREHAGAERRFYPA